MTRTMTSSNSKNTRTVTPRRSRMSARRSPESALREAGSVARSSIDRALDRRVPLTTALEARAAIPLVRWHWTMSSPIGPLTLLSDGERLCGLVPDGVPAREERNGRGNRDHGNRDHGNRDQAPFRAVIAELRAYFAGEQSRFKAPIGLLGTPFQLRVWQALLSIPCGETLSYAKLAERVGKPTAVRAVGAANGRNPISILVPCHRVVGSSGHLTGYSGGIDRKRWLLEHEAKHWGAA